MGNEFTHGVPLLVAGENEYFLTSRFPVFVKHIGQLNELLEKLQKAIPLKRLFPQICCGKTLGWGITGLAVITLVEGQKEGMCAFRCVVI